MRKRPGVLLPLLIVSLASFAVAQSKTDREKAALSGKVETVRLEHSEIREQGGVPVESPRVLESVTLYDEKGDEIEQSFYFKGRPQGKRTSQKDHAGNVTLTYYNYAGIVNGRIILKYDEWGRDVGSLSYDADGSLNRQTDYIYDQRGNLVETSFQFLNNRAFSSKTVRLYDDADRLLMERVYDADGVLKQEKRFWVPATNVVRHNKDASTAPAAAKPADPNLSWEYDSQGNWTKRSHRRKIVDEDESEEVVEVTYRKITYH